jgi:ketosteroid isomerase-like protein
MPSLTQEIETVEEELRRAMIDDNLERLDALLHPELVFTGPDGGWVNKSDDLSAHQSGAIKIGRLDFSDRQIRAWGDSAAVMVDTRMEGRFRGQPFSGRFRYTRFWRREDGTWRVIVGHCSQVGLT